MDFFINSLSLHGQFIDENQFFKSIKTLLKLRKLILAYQHALFFDRTILEFLVINQKSFRQVVVEFADRDQKSIIFSIFAKSGPFWDEPRYSSPEQIVFLYPDGESEVLTDTILQEAFIRKGSAISFSPSDFCYSPLQAKFYFQTSDVINKIDNYWSSTELESVLKKSFRLTGWIDLLNYAERIFSHLVFERELLSGSLAGEPFQRQLAQEIFKRLQVLNDFAASEINSTEEQELFKMYFTPGNQCNWFSSYSSQTLEKVAVVKDHTFVLGSGKSCFCPWHGKIRMARQFRIHFTWPVNKNKGERIHIVYIGYKLKSVRQ